MDFDKKENLHSIPARLGKKRSLFFSLMSYVASLFGMISAGLISDKKGFYWITVFLIAGIFIYQQKLARSDDFEPAIKEILSEPDVAGTPNFKHISSVRFGGGMMV